MKTPGTPSERPRRAPGKAGASTAPGTEAREAVVAALDTLDRLLGLAVDKLARLLGPATLLDPWRGMHLDADDVHRAIGADRCATLAEYGAASALSECLLRSEDAARACRLLKLDALDVAIIAIVMAPDIDLRYERIYAYLQDDISRKRPTPDLIANLLCVSTAERLQLMRRLSPNARLLQRDVLRWCETDDATELARRLRINPLWLDLFTGRDVRHAEGTPNNRASNDSRSLAPLVDAEVDAHVDNVVRTARDSGTRIRLVLQGPNGSGKFALARHVAQRADMSFLSVDLRDCGTPAEVIAALRGACDAAMLRNGLVYIYGAGRLLARDVQLVRALYTALEDEAVSFVLSLGAPLPTAHGVALSAVRIECDLPSAVTRQRAWKEALQRCGVVVTQADIELTAARFVLSCAQISQAAFEVRNRLMLTGPANCSAVELSVAARAVCGDELARLAQRVRPAAGFGALIAAPEVEAQLREICARVALRERVRHDWIGNSVHGRNVGVNALFAGPSGTGKTLAAEIIAYELGFDLFRIDLSAVVSKYIGETEKNLDRVFAAAANANAVLFFDEADALFGKRSEVKDAHDRYANIEIAYLLQKIEQFDGVAILATNLKQNLDEAFTRRLTFCINFAFPEQAERLRLWQTLWPASAPRADDVDFAVLAAEYRISGGNIRNIVVASAYLAAAEGDVITRDHVLRATRREYQKVGKTLAPVPSPIDRQAA